MGAVAAALTLSGCKKDSVEDAKDPDLELNQESIDLKIGETFNLKVTNLPDGASEVPCPCRKSCLWRASV